MTGARSGGRPRPCWHWLRCPRPGGRLRCTMTMRGRGGGERRGGNYRWSRAALLVRAALAAMRPLLSSGFDAGSCRGQKTPPTEHRLRPPTGHDPCESDLCGSGLGRDTAFAVRRLRCRPLSGSEDPSHSTPAPTADRARSLWERPWSRHGRCCPLASMQAAVGVRRPLPQKSGSDRRSGAIPVGAALAAMRPLLSAGFDAGCCRGQKTPPTEHRLRPPTGRGSCGSGLLTATRR